MAARGARRCVREEQRGRRVNVTMTGHTLAHSYRLRAQVHAERLGNDWRRWTRRVTRPCVPRDRHDAHNPAVVRARARACVRKQARRLVTSCRRRRRRRRRHRRRRRRRCGPLQSPERSDGGGRRAPDDASEDRGNRSR